MNDSAQEREPLDPRRFRTVLGHFPTGVVIVTALDPGGEPVGMVVGSFTSVSLDPPLVAFLPSRTSSSYQRLRSSDRFCVNVLGEDQELLCRRFASKEVDKFAGVQWTSSPAGSPRLEGAVAWIDCERESTHEAGDHDIVVGRVLDLGADGPSGPLLFFQGGYGRFDTGALAAPYSADLREQLQVADVTRPHLERLAAETGAEAYAQARVADDLVVVAAAGSAGRSVRTHIGRRLPFRRPFGSVFAAADVSSAATWGGADEGRLDRVRARGWSIGLVAPRHEERWSTIAAATGDEGPVDSERLQDALDAIGDRYDPADEVLAGDAVDVRAISAPVIGPDGRVVESVVLFGLPPAAPAGTVRQWSERVVATAEEVSRRLVAVDGRASGPDA